MVCKSVGILDAWWGLLPFDDMEKISGFKCCDFPTDDGSREFVAACDAWWQKLTIDEKIYHYQLYNNECY